jgi:proteasome lid subunit RPN8/RPN11
LSDPAEVRLPRATRQAIDRAALDAYPEEACGVLVGRLAEHGAAVTRSVPCDNGADASERGHRFAIEPRVVIDLQRALRGTGEEIVGFYHSHPDAEARPSETDMQYVRLWPRTVWLIAPVREGRAGEPRAWWLDDAWPGEAAPLELPLAAERD